MAQKLARIGVLIALSLFATFANADPVIPITSTPRPAQAPQIIPTAPVINAKGFILIDAYSGKILAGNNFDQRMPPASLTKMMTSYVVSAAIREGRIHMTDMVPVSEAAWKTGGSKMFIKVGSQVPVSDLMQGIIVDSGNDACVAMAEFVAGSQDSFVNLMNQQAVRLGMTSTHFMDVDGLPDPNHYSSPRDIAMLGRSLIFDFPEDYKWYSQKWFTYNGIKQPNRNRLLWRDPTVDGIKTGHTDEAGFCLAASAVRNGMRLISVVMGAPTDAARADDSQKLLTYGFRFFETHKLYNAGASLAQAKVWFGAQPNLDIGVLHDFYVTIPVGQYKNLKANIALTSPLKAPLKKGDTVGKLEIALNDKIITSEPLVALQADPEGNLFQRLKDRIVLYFTRT